MTLRVVAPSSPAPFVAIAVRDTTPKVLRIYEILQKIAVFDGRRELSGVSRDFYSAVRSQAKPICFQDPRLAVFMGKEPDAPISLLDLHHLRIEISEMLRWIDPIALESYTKTQLEKSDLAVVTEMIRTLFTSNIPIEGGALIILKDRNRCHNKGLMLANMLLASGIILLILGSLHNEAWSINAGVACLITALLLHVVAGRSFYKDYKQRRSNQTLRVLHQKTYQTWARRLVLMMQSSGDHPLPPIPPRLAPKTVAAEPVHREDLVDIWKFFKQCP